MDDLVTSDVLTDRMTGDRRMLIDFKWIEQYDAIASFQLGNNEERQIVVSSLKI